MKASNRVILNTIVLYGKLVIVLIIGLVSTRLVLSALGETDYGIYSLVAGVVGMLAFLKATLASASMRFLSHSLGKNDGAFLKRTFNTALFLHLALGIVLLIIIEIGGYFMFEYYLNIPESRMQAAKTVFHFVTLATFVTVALTPYDAVMNAHEDLFMLSVFDLVGNFIRLAGAIYLSFASYKLLVTYGFVMFLSQLIQRSSKIIYSNKRYKECQIKKNYIDKLQIKSMLSFSSWRLVGSVASIIASQIRSVIINVFFGVKLNAANGLSQQVSNQVNNLSVSMTRAIRPQLMKSEGGGDRNRMLRITTLATKYSALSFSLFAIPIYFELNYLLSLWLTDVPDYTLVFTRLILIGLFVQKLSFEIGNAISAVGRIKEVTIVESSIMVSGVGFAYFLYTQGAPPETIFIVGIAFGFLTFGARLYYGKKIAGIEIAKFLKESFLPILIPISGSVLFSVFITYYFDETLLRVIFNLLGAFFLYLFIFRVFSMTKWELEKFKGLYQTIKKRN